MAEIRFDNRVAIVTGAGNGLGRAHAKLLAARGAKVVVNDLGGTVDGSGAGSSAAADAVVAEIRKAGGHAVASYTGVDTMDGAQKIVATAKEAFGRLDIVVNNAGILRDVSFQKMTEDDWTKVLTVHLFGSMFVTKAAWPLLREGGFGRIVFTTSAAGLYGNFGQANYSAAKMGIVGLAKTLAHEGAKYDIKSNVVAPIARSRMTESILPPAALDSLKPEMVSPIVGYLASEGCKDSGQVYSVGGGYVARVAVVEAEGVRFPTSTELTMEQLAARWADVNDLENARPFANAMEAAGQTMKGTG